MFAGGLQETLNLSGMFTGNLLGTFNDKNCLQETKQKKNVGGMIF